MKFNARNAVKWLAGQRPGHYDVVDTDRLVRNWTYRPSRPDHISSIRRLSLAKNTRPFPDSVAVKPARPCTKWAAYFIYAPDGGLTPAHRFTLDRLSASDAKLLVVFASPSPDNIPAHLLSTADALYWKALPGFDFSGYTVALDALATHSPGADVFVMNDSVYGPFCALDEIWPLAQWDLTGFTASANIENHIQSYAFVLKDWTMGKMEALGTIFSRDQCFDTYQDVVFCQETRFSRVAARKMSVGALWYADYRTCADATIYAALSLAADGFPFLKKSLLTKHRHTNDPKAVTDILVQNGHIIR